MPRSFRTDDRAVTDLPLRLMITMVILAIAVPSAFAGAQKLARDSTEREVAASLAGLQAAGALVLAAGPGTSVEEDLDLRGNLLGKLAEARVGSDLAASPADGTVIAYRIDGRDERVMVTDSVCFMAEFGGGDRGALTLLSGSYTLSVTHKQGDYPGCRQGSYAELRVVEA